MQPADHTQTAEEFLRRSQQEFAAGDELQASEKLWGAVSHALIAAAQQRGWKHGSHARMREVVRGLAQETGDGWLREAFESAEKLHANYYHGDLTARGYFDIINEARRLTLLVLELVRAYPDQ